MARINKDDIETNPLRPVNEAVVEYRVIEDGALAHYLQEREIEYHHSCNVEQRRTVMGDIKEAKKLQDDEDRRARILTIDEQEELNELDGRLAEVVQEEMIQKDLKAEKERKEAEIRDKEIGLMMMERERRRERRQQKQDHVLAERLSNVRVTDGDRERMRELSDEDLARKIQEQEKLKFKQKNQNKEHIKAVIEMQDEELARFIHESEMQEAEMMERQPKGKHKRKPYKPPKGEGPPGYQADVEHPHSSRQESAHRPGSASKSRRDPRSQQAPPQRSHHVQRSSDETVPKSVRAAAPDSPLDRRRHTAREKPSERIEERPSRRANSEKEKPRRPPPPKSQSSREMMEARESARRRSPDQHHRDDRDHRSHHDERDSRDRERSRREPRLPRDRGDVAETRNVPRSDDARPKPRPTPAERTVHRDDEAGGLSDNPWARFPQSCSKQQGDDIQYGEGFARLTEQEAWNQGQYYQEGKKKNKGDCKQQ